MKTVRPEQGSTRVDGSPQSVKLKECSEAPIQKSEGPTFSRMRILYQKAFGIQCSIAFGECGRQLQAINFSFGTIEFFEKIET